MAPKHKKRRPSTAGTAVTLEPQHTSWLYNPDGSLVDWRDEDQVRAKVYAQWDEHWKEHMPTITRRLLS